MARPTPPKPGTQAATVLNHLRNNKYITDVTATGLYGIGQCAGCVHKLRNLGYRIKSTRKKGVRGTYVEYSLA